MSEGDRPGVVVASWNLHGIRAGVDAVASTVRDLDADVVLVQETGSRLRFALLGRRLGMRAVADGWAPLRRRAKDGVLIRPPWRATSVRRHRFPDPQRWYPRGAIEVRLEGPGGGFRAISTHLGLHPNEREGHAAVLSAIVAARSRPVVLGGDLNAHPGRDAHLALVAAGLRDVDPDGPPTYPAANPTARIDHVFVTEDVRASDARTATTTASDHLPVVVRLALPTA